MQDVRCKCNKLVAKLEGDKVIIKCRHCKQFVVIHAKQVKMITYYNENLSARVQRL
ncbi:MULTISPECIES: hypothetical protein [unclassified Candidatus Frackibacter]|uniref:hypothetical protein n=1 Tax=unclassified Candidatus Frackibacter TaxID=2648818 RepID=UPI000791DCFE|nr:MULTISPECIES: hypothetical protein [unclassified Candidatus Frackibacter]KXS38419.1 MAG: hypothetical protein AWU54_2223 [Candidatus Frackibacter sp. T328-2]SDC89990.1 hypothetical protein SAMN04515661_1421 [Candidatus Frackibacter sp. WG11]SEN04169.1 hypothetical protein SAMN04488698_1484 [Candidatus Frackibacter sp. WG12]SFM11842.1 hypothetical protein SAMN04488699_1444 [Candidatus Frackibacter sp. WG13]